MIKTNKLSIGIMGSIAIGTIIGVAFWWCDGGRTTKRASECPDGASCASKKAVKVYEGEWKENIVKVGEFWSVGYLERKK